MRTLEAILQSAIGLEMDPVDLAQFATLLTADLETAVAEAMVETLTSQQRAIFAKIDDSDQAAVSRFIDDHVPEAPAIVLRTRRAMILDVHRRVRRPAAARTHATGR